MDPSSWFDPDTILDGYLSDLEADPFASDIFGTKHDFKLGSTIQPLFQAVVPLVTAPANVTHFDKELEPVDFDNTPDLTDDSGPGSACTRRKEREVLAINPSCLAKAVTKSVCSESTASIPRKGNFTVDGQFEASQAPHSVETMRTCRKPSRKSTLTVQACHEKPLAPAEPTRVLSSCFTASREELDLQIAIAKHNGAKRKETRAVKTYTAKKKAALTKTFNRKKENFPSGSISFVTVKFEDCVSVINSNPEKGIRKKRKFGPEEKKRIAATRSEGACLRCRRKHKTCVKDMETGVCGACIITSKRNIGLATDMCMKVTMRFVREEEPTLDIIAGRPGMKVWLCKYLHKVYRQFSAPIPDQVLQRFRGSLYATPDSCKEKRATVILTGPPLSPPEIIGGLDWSLMLEPERVIEPTAIIHWKRLQIWRGETSMPQYLQDILCFGICLAGMLKSGSQFRFIEDALQFVTSAELRRQVTRRQTSPGKWHLNYLISEQLWSICQPNLNSSELYTLRQLREFVDTDSGAERSNYHRLLYHCSDQIPIFHLQV
ncbi:hypothetical protein BJ508DRAFT_367795 [Ascobolus immersus RN42]|uniref:Uncharacterized protein n=1 Tax=Ascobolus immersus RN42 TaxID=1160509 RepID=A0A3N4H9N8_ASCIM|nr:hypothetical protein BJ508DRAFT_367795 [Ascobolus immersus RN42]